MARAFVPIYGNSAVGMPATDGSKLVVIDSSGGDPTGRSIRLCFLRPEPSSGGNSGQPLECAAERRRARGRWSGMG
jgi:hypothetical protein